MLTGNTKFTPMTGGSWVDVRDVAQLHIEALITPAASNKRFSVSNSEYLDARSSLRVCC